MSEQRFIAYYRVSTDRQGRSGLGLDAQREAVAQFLAGRMATVIAEFVEIESGGKSDRPKLRDALDACHHEKATLLIAKLDRLARSVAFISALMEAKTNFLAVDMPHASRLVLHVMAAFAEHEREMIGERTRAALAAAKARGVRLGENGRRLAEAQKVEAIAYARQIRDAIVAARDAGARTTRNLADHLNAAGIPSRQGGCWYPASASRVLRRLSREEHCETDREAFGTNHLTVSNLSQAPAVRKRPSTKTLLGAIGRPDFSPHNESLEAFKIT